MNKLLDTFDLSHIPKKAIITSAKINGKDVTRQIRRKLKTMCHKNFFQKTINTPIGYLTRGELIALSIILPLGALVVLFFCWSFIVGLWMVIG